MTDSNKEKPPRKGYKQDFLTHENQETRDGRKVRKARLDHLERMDSREILDLGEDALDLGGNYE